MMPTFSLPSRKFRTAGFSQYGFKSGFSDRAYPCDASHTLTCHPLRPRGDRKRLVPDMRFRLRPSPCYECSALPTVLQSASRRADFSGLPGSLLLRPAKLLAPLCRSDQKLFRPPGLLPPGFRRVGHPSHR